MELLLEQLTEVQQNTLVAYHIIKDLIKTVDEQPEDEISGRRGRIPGQELLSLRGVWSPSPEPSELGAFGVLAEPPLQASLLPAQPPASLPFLGPSSWPVLLKTSLHPEAVQESPRLDRRHARELCVSNRRRRPRYTFVSSHAQDRQGKVRTHSARNPDTLSDLQMRPGFRVRVGPSSLFPAIVVPLRFTM